MGVKIGLSPSSFLLLQSTYFFLNLKKNKFTGFFAGIFSLLTDYIVWVLAGSEYLLTEDLKKTYKI